MDLFLVVVEQRLSGCQFVFASLQIFVEADQIPIKIENSGDGGNDLLLELKIGKFLVVLGDADVAA